jgi:hypothetical protein
LLLGYTNQSQRQKQEWRFTKPLGRNYTQKVLFIPLCFLKLLTKTFNKNIMTKLDFKKWLGTRLNFKKSLQILKKKGELFLASLKKVNHEKRRNKT